MSSTALTVAGGGRSRNSDNLRIVKIRNAVPDAPTYIAVSEMLVINDANGGFPVTNRGPVRVLLAREALPLRSPQPAPLQRQTRRRS
jgi:hypothetical protein